MGTLGANYGEVLEVANKLGFQIFTASPKAVSGADVVIPLLKNQSNRLVILDESRRPRPRNDRMIRGRGVSLGDIFSELVESGSVLRSKWLTATLCIGKADWLGAVRLETKVARSSYYNNHTVLMTEIFKRYPSWPEWKVQNNHVRNQYCYRDAHSSSIRYLDWSQMSNQAQPGINERE